LRVLERSDLRLIPQVRLVGEGKNDIVASLEALRMAESEGLDLVLVSDTSAPPVVRIQDFKKLQYEKKKEKAKQSKKVSELKEIQLKANISEHDLQTKVSNIEKFLERGDKVKVIVRLKGRERDNPKRAFDLLNRVSGSLKVGFKENRIPGPIATVILEPSAAAVAK